VGAMIGRGNQSNRKNLPQWRIINQKSHMTWPGLELGRPRWEAGD
jgi:hypothetical protein